MVGRHRTDALLAQGVRTKAGSTSPEIEHSKSGETERRSAASKWGSRDGRRTVVGQRKD